MTSEPTTGPSTPPAPLAWRDAAASAVPLSLAAALLAPALVLLVSGALTFALTEPARRPEGFATVWLVALALSLLQWPPAFGLLLLRPWGRWLALAVAGANFALVASGLWATTLRRESVHDMTAPVFAGLVLGHALLLVTRPVGAWLDGSRRLRDAGPGAPAYACAVGWALLLAWIVAVIVPRFREIFASMGVELPWVTQAVLEAADSVERAPFLLYPLAVLAPVPLLRVSAGARAKALALVNLVGVLGVTIVVLAIHLPIAALQRALGR